MKYLLILLLPLLVSTCQLSPEDQSAVFDSEVKGLLINPNVNLERAMDSLKRNRIKHGIFISKEHYRLAIMARGNVIKSYPVVFGRNPVDDKLMQGDKCTPEGRFGVRAKYPHKKWNKFVWIDYPTSESWDKHRSAKSNGWIPQEASIGGEIGLHGVTANDDWLIDNKVNWTLGCISMKNSDIDEIYPYISTEMPILVK